MKQIVRDYLTFNKRERNGVFILLAIITLLLIYLNISDQFAGSKRINITSFEKEIDSLNATAAKDSFAGPEARISTASAARPVKKKRTLFNFDPNNLPEADWMRLGFTDKQIKTIKNYESKGGKFRKKEDLKKMYCIKTELYESLEPFIDIQPVPAVFENGKVLNPKVAVTPAAAKAIVLIELNSADSAALTSIKGIGPFFAKAIIKYRNSLGGFYSKQQLMEVWKFDQEKFDGVEKFMTVDETVIKKVNINTCEAEQLKGPYMRWNAANAIVNYRKQHGKFKTIEDITKTDLVDEETLRKIAPYLTLE